MKLPPDQLAAAVDVPVKRSSTAMTLVPAVVGEPWVAYHEIIVWVTSSGWEERPLTPQSVAGALGLDTSASTGFGAPCSIRSASWAAGWPEQVACRAAHAGTVVRAGVEVGLGLGDGLASGVGLGLGLGDGEALADGLWLGASGPLAVQPATASRDRRMTTPFLTGD